MTPEKETHTHIKNIKTILDFDLYRYTLLFCVCVCVRRPIAKYTHVREKSFSSCFRLVTIWQAGIDK